MQTEEIADLNDEVSRLRALVTMLRSDAGIVNSQTVRSALQVNADMWDSLMNTTQRRIERLQCNERTPGYRSSVTRKRPARRSIEWVCWEKGFVRQRRP